MEYEYRSRLLRYRSPASVECCYLYSFLPYYLVANMYGTGSWQGLLATAGRRTSRDRREHGRDRKLPVCTAVGD